MNKLILTNTDFDSLVSKICRDIANSEWRPDYIVGITRGGLLPAVMISHYFKVPCDTLKISLRDGGECESNLWMAEEAFGYVPFEEQETVGCRWDVSRRKNILIVDDINDTGATINWILKDWQSGCLSKEITAWDSIWGKSVRFAAVVDNLSSQCEHKMNYCGMEVNKAEEDVWIEFPYENWWMK
jgi:hypoxanthine phosphoribosyltransferase